MTKYKITKINKSFLLIFIKGLIRLIASLCVFYLMKSNPLRPLPLKILIKKFSNKSSK